MEADWESLARDAGVPIAMVDARDRARRLMQAARERLAGLGNEEEEPKEARLSEEQARRPAGSSDGGQFAPQGGGGEGADGPTRAKNPLPEGPFTDAYERASPVRISMGDYDATDDLRESVKASLVKTVPDGGVRAVVHPTMGVFVVTRRSFGKMTSGSTFDARTADVLMNLDDVVRNSVLATSGPSERGDQNDIRAIHRLVARVARDESEFPVRLNVLEYVRPTRGWPSDLRLYEVEDVEVGTR